jgi:glycosyltransferase involved in cell wall biosynthesis
MLKLSAVIVTKNEEKIIERCLKSLSGLADEIVIVDDKSSDRTIDICGKFPNTKVIINESKGNLDIQNSIGMEQSSGEWILQLDADEVVPADTSAKILERIKDPGHYAAFNLKRRNFFLGKPILNAGNYHDKIKLFRKDKAKYIGCSIHETLKIYGEIGSINADIFHYPFNSIKGYIDRINYYSELEAGVFLKKNKAPSEKHIKYRITWKAVKTFYKLYIKKSGYKDGMHGLIWCLLNVINVQLFWMKVWEKAYKDNCNKE